MYNIISQIGLDLQFTGDSWLVKLEAIRRSGQGKSFLAGVGGFEYTYYQIRESDFDDPAPRSKPVQYSLNMKLLPRESVSGLET